MVQLGASDYITKLLNPDELLMVINTALQKKETPKNTENNVIRGKSDVAQRLCQHIDLVAETLACVLAKHF